MTTRPEETGGVLVVDDEPGIRQVCERTLSRMGFRVETAADGPAALARLGSGSFDFVLTDLSMPHPGDGEKLVEEVRRRWPATDVAIMTAYPALETAIPALKNGACDYLIKPFGQELLQAVVARCFQRRRLAGELDREKLLRAELESAYAELQKVERMKEAILSRVSHELRTPIFSAFMALETLEAPPRSGEDLKSCSILKSSLSRLKEIIENLILFADLSREPGAVGRSFVDLRGLLHDVVRRYRPLAGERQLEVEVRCEKDLAPIWGDGERLREAFKHLFVNAVRFNRQGGRILIRGVREAEGVRVSFADTGIGIPKGKAGEVFDGFYQAAEYLTREAGGMGLGLAIVRRVAEAHGGSAEVESREGQGSVFTMRLPVPAASNGG